MSFIAERFPFLITEQERGLSGLKPYALSIGLHILLLVVVAAYKGPALLQQTVPVEVIYLPEGIAAAQASTASLSRPEEKAVQPQLTERADVAEISVVQQPVHELNRADKKPAALSADERIGADVGTSGAGMGEGLATAQALSLKQQYILNLRTQLERHKVYPRTAQKLRQSGKVMLMIEVQADGRITERKIIEPARYAKLTEAAFALISSLDRLPPIPEELRVQSWQIQVPIEYELR